MGHAWTMSNRTFRLHESFRIIYNEKYSFFQCSFSTDRSVSVQTRNLRFFANEIFKDSKEWLQTYSLISLSQCPLKTSVHTISLVFSWVQIRSVFNGTETIALLGLKIWNLVLLVINQKKYINDFFYNDLGVLHCLYWFNFMYELNRSKNC